MCRRELLELAIDHPVVVGHSSLIRGVVVLEAETGRRRDKDMNRLARGQASELWNVVLNNKQSAKLQVCRGITKAWTCSS